VEILLVRHGARNERARGAEREGLSDHGHHQASTLAEALSRRKVRPTWYLTSRHQHARDTARILRDRLSDANTPLLELDALTPRRGSEALDRLVPEAESRHVDLADSDSVCIVGHEGRLSNLATELTGSRIRQLDHGEALLVAAPNLIALLQGHGKVHSRYPVLDHHEDRLREKVQSKMTVATFLAGFVFSALSAVLLLEARPWPLPRLVAVVALTGSLCLFIASVYVYDQLSTPVGFWTDARTPWGLRWLSEWHERRREDQWHRISQDPKKGPTGADEDAAPWRLDGPIYRYMVATARWVFNPAVALALVGFLALLWGTGDRRIIALSLLAIVSATGYAAWKRPALGAD
jgi:phosphohistidine phosphatase SixA